MLFSPFTVAWGLRGLPLEVWPCSHVRNFQPPSTTGHKHLTLPLVVLFDNGVPPANERSAKELSTLQKVELMLKFLADASSGLLLTMLLLKTWSFHRVWHGACLPIAGRSTTKDQEQLAGKSTSNKLFSTRLVSSLTNQSIVAHILQWLVSQNDSAHYTPVLGEWHMIFPCTSMVNSELPHCDRKYGWCLYRP